MDLQDRFNLLRAEEQRMHPNDYAMLARVQARLFPPKGSTPVERVMPAIAEWTAYVAFLLGVLIAAAVLGSAAGTLLQTGHVVQAIGVLAAAFVCAYVSIRRHVHRS